MARKEKSGLQPLRELIRVCVLTATGREAALARELKSSVLPQQHLREAILQTYLFAGFPRAINGLWVLNQTLGYEKPWREPPGPWRPRGVDLCQRIYDGDYVAMMRNMERLHPDLAEWILVEGYGKTLSRPYFDAKTRELLVVPVLAALGCWRQMPSHVKGTVNVGGTRKELIEALDAARGLIPAESLRRARAMVSKLV